MDDAGQSTEFEIARLRAELARHQNAPQSSAAASDKTLIEAQHRMRNILALTRLVFIRSMEGDADPEQVRSHFLGRLNAISRIGLNLLRTASQGMDLEDMIRDELLTVGVSDGPQLVLRGPKVGLNAEAAEGIGLALHELATNALKFGALRGDGARLEISWDIDARDDRPPLLTLSWTEQGVPAVPIEPGRQGFGSELILEALPYRLGAETALEFRGGGIRCSMVVPLAREAGARAATWR